MRAAVIFSTLILAILVGSSNGSLLPFMDPAGSGSGSFSLLNQLLDSFQVLEQMPLSLDSIDTQTMHLPARVDWKETPQNHIIMLDVPGLNKEELKIEVDDNRILKVIGERKREDEKKGDHWHRFERYYGKFWRQFRLPENVDVQDVKAKLENGVLTLTLSKLSPDKIKGPRVVSIAAAGGESDKEPAAKQEL